MRIIINGGGDDDDVKILYVQRAADPRRKNTRGGRGRRGLPGTRTTKYGRPVRARQRRQKGGGNILEFGRMNAGYEVLL